MNGIRFYKEREFHLRDGMWMDRLRIPESRKIDIIGDKSASVLEMVSLVLLAHHDGLELLVVDGAGSVLVDLVNHLVNIGLRHRLVKGQKDLLQHLGVDGAFAFLVEDSESLSDFLLLLGLLGLLRHEDQEFVKVDEAGTVAVNLLDALLELIRLKLMTQHPHDGAQFGGGNFTGSLLVDSFKGILEVGNEGVGQLVLGLFRRRFVTHGVGLSSDGSKKKEGDRQMVLAKFGEEKKPKKKFRWSANPLSSEKPPCTLR